MITLFNAVSAAWFLPAGLLLAMCTHESHLDQDLHIMDKGTWSYGLCSVKLIAARDVAPGIKRADLMNPTINAHVAAAYLYKQWKRYHNWDKAVLAYNAGRYKTRRGVPVNQDYLDRVNQVKRRLRKVNSVMSVN